MAKAGAPPAADRDDEPVDLLEDEPQLDLRDPAPTVDADAIVASVSAGSESVTTSARAAQSWSAAHDDLLPGQPLRDQPAATPIGPVGSPPVSSAKVEAAPLAARPVATESDDAPTGEIPPLPHWTEPPTGAVPAIFADDADTPDEGDAWATVTGAEPRFRAGSRLGRVRLRRGSLGGEREARRAVERGPGRRGRGVRTRPRGAPPGPAAGAVTRPRRPPRTRPPGPSRLEADRAPSAPAPARDLPTAIMTGLAVAVVAIVSFTHNATTVALTCLVVGVATLELASSLRKRGLRPATLVALVASTLMPLAARHYGTAAFPVFFGLVVIVSLLWFLWEITPGRPLPGVASTILVFAYVGGLGGFAGLLLASPKDNGVRLLLGVALCVIAYDVLGFFVGSQFGHTAVAPKISPNKTVEGTVAGMIAAVVVGVGIVGPFIHPWTTGKGLVLGILVAAGAFVGDLCESMLKRDLDLKDFGSLLPGHGGVLDRFDALLFCLPIAYYLALQFKIY